MLVVRFAHARYVRPLVLQFTFTTYFASMMIITSFQIFHMRTEGDSERHLVPSFVLIFFLDLADNDLPAATTIGNNGMDSHTIQVSAW